MSVKNLLAELTLESGAVIDESVNPADDLNAVLIDEVGGREQSAATIADRAEDAGAIAVQLDDLADRAEEADESGGSEELKAVTTESLRREFGALTRAWKINFPATSFENAEKGGELRGLAQDARRLSALSKQLRKDIIGDYSGEANGIVKALRGDRQRILASGGTLLQLQQHLMANKATLKDHAFPVNNDGFKRFMTREGKEVTNLKAAIHAEAEYFKKTQAVIIACFKEATAAAAQLNSGQRLTAVKHFATAKLFASADKLATPKGYLMGDFEISVTAPRDEQYPGISIPKYERTGGTKLSTTDKVKTAATYAAGLGMIFLGGGMYMAAQAGAFGTSAGIAAAAGAAPAIAGMAVGMSGQKIRSMIGNGTEVKSAASLSDLEQIINDVLGYKDILNSFHDYDTFNDHLENAASNVDALGKEVSQQLHDVVHTLDDTVLRLLHLESELYDQAFYTITHLASALITVINGSKTFIQHMATQRGSF